MKNYSIQQRLDKALKFKNQDEADQYEAEKLQLDIIAQLQEYMELNKITKADLAKKLNISKSFITQLFSGDKLLNLKILAKLQRRFNIKFTTILIDNNNSKNFFDKYIMVNHYNNNSPKHLKIYPKKNSNDATEEFKTLKMNKYKY
jgi:transcriptional regulator with XRE-family HTH domain